MNLIADLAQAAIPIDLLSTEGFVDWVSRQSEFVRNFLTSTQFRATNGALALVPGTDGRCERVLVIGDEDDLYALAKLPSALPSGLYRLAHIGLERKANLLLGFALGGYQFLRYLPKQRRLSVQLVVLDEWLCERVNSIAAAVFQARDLVNTPTEDCGPADLSETVAKLAKRFGARMSEVVGDELLRQNFPAIHAVGRASHRPPRLIELNWGSDKDPRLVLVGKGVCFDTGGLDIKTADGMAAMKKDMGGGAVAISLAQLVMAANIRVRLKLLVPAVENSIGPNSYRPGEVIATRAGLSVEIGNTDAEGRVILCDALTYGAEFQPDLMIDFATLTGAARVALGPDLPALFGRDEVCVRDLLAAGRSVYDPLWPMPLWQDYQRMLDSPIADLNNAGSSRMAGAITAALYLDRFVPADVSWLHIDTYCWQDADRPGRTKGGACQSLRSAFAFLESRYGDV